MTDNFGFVASLHVEDPEPEVLVSTDSFSYRGSDFLAHRWVADTPNPVNPVWTWYRSGPVLKKDGTARADKAYGSVRVDVADVPQWVKDAFREELFARADRVRVLLDRWLVAVEREAVGLTGPSREM